MIVDLTQTLQNGISIYPGTEIPSFEKICTVAESGSAVMRLSLNSHSGTHMDAPAHFILNGKTLDQLEMEELIGNGLVINCSGIDKIDADHLKPFINQISKVKFLLFYTGWDQKWNTPEYLNPFPVLTPEAIEWLLQFPLKGLGFDSFSADPIDSVDFPNHQLILGNGLLIIENLTNLDQLLNQSFDFYTIPLKIKDSDGSPIRAFAKLTN